MRRAACLFLFLATVGTRAAAPGRLELPAFPLPSFVREDGATVEVTPTRILREFHKGGVHGLGDLETVDSDYGLLRQDSLAVLAAWLESACRSVGFDLSQARSQPYDGSALARLLTVATNLAGLQKEGQSLAAPIGTLVCERRAKWGDLPGDGMVDAYVVFATEGGIMIYDPPTRQLTALSEFPNRERILRIRF